jgi:Flp pilus assembly pilin Flp
MIAISGRHNMDFIARLVRDEHGATAIEYGLVLVLCTFRIISASQGMGLNVGASLDRAAAGFEAN